MDTAKRLCAMLTQLGQMAEDADHQGREDEYELLDSLAKHARNVLGTLALAATSEVAA